MMSGLVRRINRTLYRGGRFLCRFRGTAFVDAIAAGIAGMAEQLENVNWDFEKNDERRVLDLLKQIDPQCAFDVGANQGDWCSLMVSVYPACKIHAFEIVPSTFQQLRNIVGSNPNIILSNFGLSDENGTITMSFSGEDPSTATACPIKGMRYHKDFYTNQTKCEVRKAVDYIREFAIDTIDFLKVDVEGMDLKVLRGFEDAIKQVRVIQFEYGIFNISSHDLLSDFCDYLAGKGFVVGKIFPRHVAFFDYHFSKEKFYGANYLAVRRDEEALVKTLATYSA